MGENKRIRLITAEGNVREFPNEVLDSFRVVDSLLCLSKGKDCVAVYNMNYILCVEYI